jgi:hypothetical protein
MNAETACLIGIACIAGGAFWFLVSAFRANPDLGVMYLFIGVFLQPVMVIKNVKEFWKPFALELVGIVIVALSIEAMSQ